MKLNHECFRDVLLYLEYKLNLGQKIKFDFKTDIALTSKYSKEDIIYSSLKLLEAGFINAKAYNSVQPYGPFSFLCNIAISFAISSFNMWSVYVVSLP